MVNTNEPRNEREASANVKAWPSDRDVAAMLASSGAIEGRRRTPPVRGLARRLFGVMRVASVVLAVWVIAYIGPRAVSWISEHLGATAAAVSL